MFRVIHEYDPPLLRWAANASLLQPTVTLRSFYVHGRIQVRAGDLIDGFLCQWTTANELFTTHVNVVAATTIDAALTPELALRRLHRSLVLEREGMDAEIERAVARRSLLIQQERDALTCLQRCGTTGEDVHKPTEEKP
jgi:hypothetical protein